MFNQVKLKLHRSWKAFALLLLPSLPVGVLAATNGTPFLYAIFFIIALVNLHFAAHASLIVQGTVLGIKDEVLSLSIPEPGKSTKTNEQDERTYFDHSNWFGQRTALLRLYSPDKKSRILFLSPWTCNDTTAVRRLKVHYKHNSSLHFKTATP